MLNQIDLTTIKKYETVRRTSRLSLILPQNDCEIIQSRTFIPTLCHTLRGDKIITKKTHTELQLGVNFINKTFTGVAIVSEVESNSYTCKIRS